MCLKKKNLPSNYDTKQKAPDVMVRKTQYGRTQTRKKECPVGREESEKEVSFHQGSKIMGRVEACKDEIQGISGRKERKGMSRKRRGSRPGNTVVLLAETQAARGTCRQ